MHRTDSAGRRRRHRRRAALTSRRGMGEGGEASRGSPILSPPHTRAGGVLAGRRVLIRDPRGSKAAARRRFAAVTRKSRERDLAGGVN